MKKRVYLIAAVVSGALAVSGCTTNPYTGEREALMNPLMIFIKIIKLR